MTKNDFNNPAVLRAMHRPKTLLNSAELKKAKEQALESCQQGQSAALSDELARESCRRAPTLPAKAALPPKQADTPKPPGKRRRVMNKTEAAYACMLEGSRITGRIQGWYYEGMTLRWGTLDSISYTPDFLVFSHSGILLVEVKGSKLWKDTTQKFKAARNQWPQFQFQMWQSQRGGWTQLY